MRLRSGIAAAMVVACCGLAAEQPKDDINLLGGTQMVIGVKAK